MFEPTLQSIEDYNGLKGEKKHIVRAVIISGLFIGSLYVIIANSYVGDIHDAFPVSDSISAVLFNR